MAQPTPFNFDAFEFDEDTTVVEEEQESRGPLYNTVAFEQDFSELKSAEDFDLSDVDLLWTRRPLVAEDGTVNFVGIFNEAISQALVDVEGTPVLGLFELPLLREDYVQGDGRDPFVLSTMLAIAVSEEYVVLLDCNLERLQQIVNYTVTINARNEDRTIRTVPVTGGVKNKFGAFFNSNTPIGLRNLTEEQLAKLTLLDERTIFDNRIMSREDLNRNAALAIKDKRFSSYAMLESQFSVLALSSPDALKALSGLYKENEHRFIGREVKDA